MEFDMSEPTCLNCGVPIPGPTGKPGRVRLHCSKRCTNARHQRAQRERARLELPTRTCPVCGVDMTSRRSDATFCSLRCGEVSRGQRLPEPLPDRVCALPECNVVFVPNRRATRCCSERHGKMLYNRESRADGRQPLPKWDDKRRAAWKARYALTRGAPDAESFDYREVYDRDGWICGLCAEPVDPELRWPDPMSVSLDHIVPVSRGGRHVRENAQCSHLRCNVSKGAAA